MHAIMIVLVVPPILSCRRRVSFESRYGICVVFVWTSDEITLFSADNERLIFADSSSCWPLAPVFSWRSLPAIENIMEANDQRQVYQDQWNLTFLHGKFSLDFFAAAELKEKTSCVIERNLDSSVLNPLFVPDHPVASVWDIHRRSRHFSMSSLLCEHRTNEDSPAVRDVSKILRKCAVAVNHAVLHCRLHIDVSFEPTTIEN